MGKGDISDCNCYGAVKHLEHGMKVIERVLEKGLCGLVTINKMQFGFMPEKRTIDAVLVLRRLHEEDRANRKMLSI